VAEESGHSRDQDPESSALEEDKKLLETARARFKVALDAERDNRLLAAEDRRFRKGEQWPDEIKQAREADGRPCLTINKIPQFEQQITNDQRQNRPQIKVHPVDDQADPDTANVFQGVIKNIEVSSGADTARDTAFENAVRGGHGFYRIVTAYVAPDSFEQEIRVKRIRDADSVLLDPNHQEPDGSDAEYGFIFEHVPKDLYRQEYGDSKLCEETEWSIESNLVPDWVKRDTVLVAEYFYKDYVTKHLVLLSDGQIMEKGEADAHIAASATQAVDEQGAPIGEPTPSVQVVKERTTQVPTVRWCKLNGAEILSKTDWLGQWIPILPVYGAELVVDGVVIRESLIRHAKDPSRMYNFWKSAETEAITLAPKAPFVVEEHQLEGYEEDWKAANRKNHAYLKYKAFALNGTPLPPPQRQAVEPPVQAITQASMLAADEVKATLGIYNASLGAQSNETSGVAIQRRNQQAQTSNFHFTDNLNRTIRHEGRILVDLIPKVYDTARVAHIIGEDGEKKIVKINQEYQDESGKIVKHDLGAGKYDVTIDTGPSYATRRQEAAAFMQEMVRSYPATMQVAGDLVVKNMDVPGASELAERFKKTLDPKLVDDPKSKQIPPQVQAQMQQMGQMVEQLTSKLHEAQDTIDHKRLELESRERIEMKKLEVELEIERAKLDAKDSLAVFDAEISQLERRLGLLQMSAPIESAGQSNPDQSAQPTDGASNGAPVGMAGQAPIGGESPSPSIEGNSDANPNA
jgi:hypothetical protein